MGFISSSCAASVFMGLYVSMAVFNLYGLMYPLTRIDLTTFAENEFIHPFWKEETPMHMTIYLSNKPKFDQSFVLAEFPDEEYEDDDEEEDEDEDTTILLWKQDIATSSLSKSFLLSTLECTTEEGDESCGKDDPSYQSAKSWLDEAEANLLGQDGTLISTISSAGQGIESTSILLTAYQSASKSLTNLATSVGLISKPNEDEEANKFSSVLQRSSVHLPADSKLWASLAGNLTLYVHVLVTQPFSGQQRASATNSNEALEALRQASKSQSLLLGQVDLVKHEEPHHIHKPGRILYHDVAYILKKYVLRTVSENDPAPWDMKFAKPDFHQAYEMAQGMKETGAGYPYWKPEVAVKYLLDSDAYPYDFAHVSGMELIRVTKTVNHPTGIAHMPALHVDEIGLTSEKYIPINETLTSLPLRISFDRSDMKDDAATTKAATATAGGISPARWRLLSHLSQAIESQKQLGFEQSDIDDLRRLIADTNVTLLGITMLASALHLLFEFLTFKSEVNFWRNNQDLTGLSVRSLFLDMLSQVIIVLYLIEKNSSLLMTIPSAFGCLIALWKCQRAAGFAFVKVSSQSESSSSWWNALPRLLGYEIVATRLIFGKKKKKDKKQDGEKNESSAPSSSAEDLHELTLESDRIATSTLGRVLLPLVLIYTVYSLVMEEHIGWYSWLITSASTAVYALGFVLMTPQLFLNYKLKSVAHLPWRVLVYKSLNTFIDDLFSFIIRMPTMARISCFRDDVVFFIYLYQRWLYPVDTSRPVEGGGDSPEKVPANDTAKKNQ